jgi:hypothetical protein
MSAAADIAIELPSGESIRLSDRSALNKELAVSLPPISIVLADVAVCWKCDIRLGLAEFEAGSPASVVRVQ